MIQPFSAASEFGFPNSWSTDASDGQAATPSTEPRSVLPQVEASVSGKPWQHPSVAIFALVLLGAGAIAHTTRPLAGAKASGHVGPAKGSIEGEL